MGSDVRCFFQVPTRLFLRVRDQVRLKGGGAYEDMRPGMSFSHPGGIVEKRQISGGKKMYRKTSKLMVVLLVVSFAITAIASPVFAKAEMYPAKKTAVDWIDANEGRLIKLSDAIWSYAELGWQEFKSSKAHQDFLEENGFKVQSIPGLATAFVATYGSGRPVIGILGEFDSVASVSQEAFVPFQDPVTAIGGEVAPGHGCGHNLYGTGSFAAAVAIAKAMDRYGLKGTVKAFGTPAEEILEGKIYMARDGVFDGVDVILSWHPGSSNRIGASSNLALISVKFSFNGVSAHAGTSPDRGRSALDAVMITDVAANYVREHMIEGDRIQGVVTKGGVQPNVVPDFAEMWYFLRAPDVPEVKDLLRRITNCAKAGALATDTEMTRQIVTGTWDKLPNLRLAQLSWDNLDMLGIVEWTPEEVSYAKEMQKDMGKPEVGLATTLGARPSKIGSKGRYSSDAGDLSWIAPMGGGASATGVPGSAGHSWQNVSAYGSSIGTKGMIKAAQVIAAMAIDLLDQPEILNEATAEFKERSKGTRYESLLDPDSKPSLDYFRPEMEKFEAVMEEHYTSPK